MFPPTMSEHRTGTFATAMRYLGGSRAREAALMVGFPMAGPAFALDALTLAAAGRVMAFGCAMFLLFLSLYEFNDYCGHRADALNPRLQEPTQVSRDLHLKRAAMTLGAAVLIFGFLQPVLALGAVVSFGLWSIYSWPAKGWKEVPVLGTGVHFVTQSLHFLMGWAVVAEVSLGGILIALFFGGLFAAGHLYHEVIDFEADRQAGVRTTANRIGRLPALWLSSAAFGICAAYWALLYATNRIDAGAFAPFCGAFVIHAATLALYGATGRLADRAGVIRLRGAYRGVYLLAGLAFVIQKFGFHGIG